MQGIPPSGTLTLRAGPAGSVLESRPPAHPTPLTCIAGLVGVKIAGQRLNWKWSPAAARSCWGFGFSGTRHGSGKGREAGSRGRGAEHRRDPPPGRAPVCPSAAPGTRWAVPLLRGSARTDMGNAPICQACHSEKGLRTHGNIQDLDKTPDYYGYNSEESKEPEALVSFG